MDQTDDHRELLALREALHWRQAREDLIYFAETIEIPATEGNASEYEKPYPVRIKPAAHHRLILRSYQDMITGKLDVDGLIIMMPPGSAKSTYASKVCPSWSLGRRRSTNVIAVSYSSTLAEQWGYQVRQIVKGDEYGKIFPDAALRADQGRVLRWSMSNESSYRADGYEGSITGFRADILVLDDLIAGHAEAMSETIRNRVWNSVNSDLMTRLKPNGKILLIGTHWHENDPQGRILGEDWKGQSGIWSGTDGRKWFVINCPRKAEHEDDPLGRKIGEWLWPEYFLMKDNERLEKVGGYEWSALQQQRPAPNTGAILNREWWRKWPHEDPPVCDYVFLAYDTSFKKAITNDPSAMTAWGIFRTTAEDRTLAGRVVRQGDEIFHAIMLGAWEERVQSVDLLERIVGRRENGKLVEKGHIHIWPEVLQKGMILVEDKASGQGIIQELQRMRLPVAKVAPSDPTSGLGDRQLKMTPRAQTVAFLLSAGSVWYMPGATTNRVLDQCAAIPFAQHDDLACTAIYALQYFRDKFYFTVPSDFLDPQEEYERQIEEYENDRHKRSVGGYGHIRQDSHSYVPDGQRRGYGRIG